MVAAGCGGSDEKDGGGVDLAAGPPADMARPDHGDDDGGTPLDPGCVTSPSSDYHPFLSTEIISWTAMPPGKTSSLAWTFAGYSTGIDHVVPKRGCFVQTPGPTLPNAKEVHGPAGTMTITGGTRAATLQSTAPGEYVFSDGSIVWPGDARLGFDIGGACDVPMSHFDIVMPKSIVFMTPAENAVLPRTSDLAVGWTPGSGELEMRITGSAGSVDCTFDAASGSGTIPSAMLQALGAGSASVQLVLGNHVVTHLDGRSYAIEAYTDVLLSDGTRLDTRKLTLQ
jgi:hypothetical protein